MVIDPLQTVPVVEQLHRPARSVGDQTLKPAIQSLGKVRFLFIPVH